MKQKLFLILICMVLLVDTLLAQTSFHIDYHANHPDSVKTREGGTQVATSGGSFSVQFNRQTPVPSLLDIQGPSMSMSCSSFSMKGMYGELITLSELTDTLEQAGKSYAWGVLLGIVSSLPTIGDVFAKLNAWVKEIQKMLANACNLGSQMGRNLAHGPVKEAVNSALPSIAISDKLGKYVQDTQEAMGSLVPELEKILTGEYTNDEGKQDVAVDLALSVSPISNSFAASFVKSEINTNLLATGHGAKMVLKSNFAQGTSSDITIIPNSPVPDIRIYPTKMLPTELSGVINPGYYKFDAAMFLFVYNFLISQDNVVIYDKAKAFMEHIVKNISEITANGSITKEDAKAHTRELTKTSEVVKKIQEDSANMYNGLTTTIGVPNPPMDGNNNAPTLLEFLLNYQASNIIFSIPQLALIDLQKFDTLFVVGVDSPLVSTASSSGSAWGTILNQYSDIETKARAQVECLFKEDNNTKVDVTNYDGNTQNNISCASLPPVIVPQARRMLRIYQQSDEDERVKIKSLVEGRNVRYMLIAVKQAIMHGIKVITANNKDILGNSVVNNNSTDLKSIPKNKSMKININQPELKAFVNGVDNKIEKLVKQKYAIDIRDFDEYLDRLEKKNKKRGMRDLY